MNGWDGAGDSLLVDVRDGVTVVTLNRPAKLNALTEPMLVALAEAIKSAGLAGASRGIVITGAGPAFSAGQDLDAAASIGEEDAVRMLECFNDVTRAVLGTEVPVCAAINGIAVGGGAEITLACDVRIAASRSEFFLPETGNGMPIGNGTSYLLPRLVGSHALWLVVGSRRIDAGEALRIGLFDRVLPDDRLLESAEELMREWGAPGRAMPQHLRMMRPPADEVEAAMAREVEAAREGVVAGVMERGVRALLERTRAPGA